MPSCTLEFLLPSSIWRNWSCVPPALLKWTRVHPFGRGKTVHRLLHNFLQSYATILDQQSSLWTRVRPSLDSICKMNQNYILYIVILVNSIWWMHRKIVQFLLGPLWENIASVTNPLAATKDSCVVNGTRSAGGGFELTAPDVVATGLFGITSVLLEVSYKQTSRLWILWIVWILWGWWVCTVQVKTTTHYFLSKSLNPQPTSEILPLGFCLSGTDSRPDAPFRSNMAVSEGKTHWFHCAIWRSCGSSLVIVMPCFMTGDGASKFRWTGQVRCVAPRMLKMSLQHGTKEWVV